MKNETITLTETAQTIPPIETGEALTANTVRGAVIDEEEESESVFPLDCLPPVLKNMAQSISDATQTPIALSACCVLGVTSASIGKGLRVTSSTSGRQTGGNLFLLASARSGTGKSEAFRDAVSPLLEFERRIVDEWEATTLPKAKAETQTLKLEAQRVLKELADASAPFEKGRLQDELAEIERKQLDTVKHLTAPALTVEDCTQEKLAVMLQDNQESIASLTADGGNIVSNLLGRYSKKADQTDDNLYLRGYSMEPCRVDRLGRAPVTLSKPCVSALWLVQPDKVDRLLANRTLTEGGLIPRMLVCHTHTEPQEITGPLPKIPVYHADRYAETITDCLSVYRMADTPFVIEATAGAMKLLTEYHNEIVRRRRSDLRDMDSYAARWAENAWRLAVCLHAGTYGKAAKDKPLDHDTAAKAIQIMRFFSERQMEILGEGRTSNKESEFQKIESFARKHTLGFAARDLQRLALRPKKINEVQPLLDEMVSLGKLSTAISTKGTGGRPKHIYFLPAPPLK